MSLSVEEGIPGGERRGTSHKAAEVHFLTCKKGLLGLGRVLNKLDEEHGPLGPGSLDLHTFVPLTSCVIVGKFFNLSGPWHPSNKVGTTAVPTHRIVLRTK